MGRAASSVYDEWKRNRVRGAYDPAKAHHKAYVRRKYAKYQGMKIVAHDALRRFVRDALMDDQSPEAIAGHTKKHRKDLPSISKESIYRFITSVYGRRIENYRFHKRTRRRGTRTNVAALPNRTFIDKRPSIINTRGRVGDVEFDFIVSGKSGKGMLLVVVDRKLRTVFLERIIRITIPNFEQAFLRIKSRFPEMRTGTTDNDILLRHHERLGTLLGIRIFFCHPYHSWEKGTVENANKAIRKDIPKRSDISRYSRRFIANLESKLNRRFMDCLNHRTPAWALAAHRMRLQKQKRSR